MMSRDFCYWLQGFFEITGKDLTILNTDQIDLIKRHLNLVFKHEIDPSFGDEKYRTELQEIHDGPDCEKPEDAALTPEKIREILEQTAKDLREKHLKVRTDGNSRFFDPHVKITC